MFGLLHVDVSLLPSGEKPLHSPNKIKLASLKFRGLFLQFLRSEWLILFHSLNSTRFSTSESSGAEILGFILCLFPLLLWSMYCSETLWLNQLYCLVVVMVTIMRNRNYGIHWSNLACNEWMDWLLLVLANKAHHFVTMLLQTIEQCLILSMLMHSMSQIRN